MDVILEGVVLTVRTIFWWMLSICSAVASIGVAILWINPGMRYRSAPFHLPASQLQSRHWIWLGTDREGASLAVRGLGMSDATTWKALIDSDDEFLLLDTQNFWLIGPHGPLPKDWTRLEFKCLGLSVFALKHDAPANWASYYSLRTPYWMLLLVALTLSGLGGYRIRRAVRIAPTVCKSCGYDLRAGHEKCPECGEDSHVKATIATNSGAAVS